MRFALCAGASLIAACAAEPVAPTAQNAQPTSEPHVVSVAECSPERLHASYRVSAPGGDASELELVRRGGDTVLHVFGDLGVTELWYRGASGHVVPTRLFDEDRRGIEYDTADLRDIGREGAWGARWSLVPPEWADGDAAATAGQGCEAVRAVRGDGFELHWNVALALPTRLETADRVLELERVRFGPSVEREFRRRADYHLVDFADIGDMEDDPFLQGLIGAGLLEHRVAGGGVDADGHGHIH